MRKHKSHFLVLFILMATVLFSLTGCSSGDDDEIKEQGATYVKLSEYIKGKKTDQNSVRALKEVYNNEDGYICIVTDGARPELVIPDEVKGKPVIALMSADHNPLRPTSLTIGKNVKYIIRFHLDCRELKTLVIPDNVVFSNSSFPKMQDATVTLEGSPDIKYAFGESSNVNVVVKDLSQLSDVTRFWSNLYQYEGRYEVELGTEDLLKYSDSVDGEALLARAEQHFGEKLDPNKEVDESKAGAFYDHLDGPLISIKECPAVDYPEYDNMTRESILADNELYYMSVANIADSYPEDAYQPKIDKPQKYVIVEKIGGVRVDYIGTDKEYYKMVFRVSVRNIETDELAFWFETTPGYAPSGIRSDEYTQRLVESGRIYFNDYDGNQITPEYVVHKYLQ